MCACAGVFSLPDAMNGRLWSPLTNSNPTPASLCRWLLWCDDPRRIHRQPRYRFLSSFKGSLVVDFEPKCCVFAHECFSRVCPSSGRRVATSSAAHHSLFGQNMTSVLIHRMEATRPKAKFENCNVSKLRNVACTPPDVLPLSTPPPFFLFGLVTDVRKTDEDAA